jgi:hypothetical protein
VVGDPRRRRDPLGDDAQAGVLPDDVELARTLRKTAKPVTLAVNKIDVPRTRRASPSSTGLGFERTRAISGRARPRRVGCARGARVAAAGRGGEREQDEPGHPDRGGRPARTSARARS